MDRLRLAPVLVGALIVSACSPADSPQAVEAFLPAAALEYLAPERTSSTDIAAGVRYHTLRSAEEPWEVHLVEVDTRRCDVGFGVLKAPDDSGRMTVSDLVARDVNGALVAINGDFFTEESRPIGVEIAGGTLRGRAARPVFAWRPGAAPWVGPLRWDGDSIRVGAWSLSAAQPDRNYEIVAGFPALLRDGRWVGDLEQEERPAFASNRHPRTAVGWDPESRTLWLAVVEGRRAGSAEGMTLPELAELLRHLGATEALNLDGGGSSVMVVEGRTVSRPSDRGGERAVVNALVVRRDPAYCSVPRAD